MVSFVQFVRTHPPHYPFNPSEYLKIKITERNGG